MSFSLQDLKEGSNIMEWFIIMNNSYAGHPLGIVFVVVIGVIFTIMLSARVPFLNALLASSFLGFIITAFLWVARFDGSALIPTFYPVLFVFLLGGSIILKVTENILNQ